MRVPETIELDDGEDSLSEDQRRALDEAISVGLREAAAGEGVPAAQVLASLRARSYRKTPLR